MTSSTVSRVGQGASRAAGKGGHGWEGRAKLVYRSGGSVNSRSCWFGLNSWRRAFIRQVQCAKISWNGEYALNKIVWRISKGNLTDLLNI